MRQSHRSTSGLEAQPTPFLDGFGGPEARRIVLGSATEVALVFRRFVVQVRLRYGGGHPVQLRLTCEVEITSRVSNASVLGVLRGFFNQKFP